MFKYVKDFFRTLSMEIGGVKSRSVDISVDVNTSGVEIGMGSPKVFSTYEKPKIGGETFSGSAVVRSGSLQKSILKVASGSFSSESAGIEDPLRGFKTRALSESFESELVLRSVDLRLRGFKTENARFRFRTSVKDGRDIPSIWNVSYRKSPLVEKDKILDALARLLRRYGGKPEKMEFLGYFKGVPIGMAEAMMVEKGRLVLRISRKRARRFAVVDLVAIRTPKGVMVEVVR